MRQKKTDNASLAAKLDLRRYFLQKYHADDRANVLDCCQGSGVIWKQLRKEFSLAGYWGVDLKSKRGRLRINSVRILSMPGLIQNVIDIDTYGSPWQHWRAMLPHTRRSVSVFLTVGQKNLGLTDTLQPSIIFGSEQFARKVPPSLRAAVNEQFGTDSMLAQAARHGLKLLEIVEATGSKSGPTRYIGVRLEAINPLPVSTGHNS